MLSDVSPIKVVSSCSGVTWCCRSLLCTGLFGDVLLLSAGYYIAKWHEVIIVTLLTLSSDVFGTAASDASWSDLALLRSLCVELILCIGCCFCSCCGMMRRPCIVEVMSCDALPSVVSLSAMFVSVTLSSYCGESGAGLLFTLASAPYSCFPCHIMIQLDITS